MHRLPRVIPILIGIIVFDLTLAFGIEAYRILSSPILGLELPAFARMIYSLGKFAELGPVGHVKLAAMFGGVYLTIAVMCTLYLASRVNALYGGRPSHDLLDATMILIVISTLAAATPAMLQGATEFLMVQRLPLWLVGLAATLSMVERVPDMDENAPASFLERGLMRLFAIHREPKEPAYVTPAVRDGLPSAQYSELRNEAGMKMRAEFKTDGMPYAMH